MGEGGRDYQLALEINIAQILSSSPGASLLWCQCLRCLLQRCHSLGRLPSLPSGDRALRRRQKLAISLADAEREGHLPGRGGRGGGVLITSLSHAQGHIHTYTRTDMNTYTYVNTHITTPKHTSTLISTHTRNRNNKCEHNNRTGQRGKEVANEKKGAVDNYQSKRQR